MVAYDSTVGLLRYLSSTILEGAHRITVTRIGFLLLSTSLAVLANYPTKIPALLSPIWQTRGTRANATAIGKTSILC